MSAVAELIFTPEDVRRAHQKVVDRVSEVVGWEPVALHHHDVLVVFRLFGVPLDQVG